MFTCGWCGTHYETWRNRCDSCGGTMPARRGEELGEAPPPAPRALPKGFEFRTKWSGNVIAIVGGAFLLIGGLLLLVFIGVGLLVGAILPLLFMIGGFAMLRIGRHSARGALSAFQRGIAVEGKVFSVALDHSQTLNGQHPWKLTYHFEAEGQTQEGTAVSWDSTVSLRTPGQPLWVLYLPEDPGQNTLYPPLK